MLDVQLNWERRRPLPSQVAATFLLSLASVYVVRRLVPASKLMLG